jgi:1-acyl-sn-glycerol-3-phosphate acyltransferase
VWTVAALVLDLLLPRRWKHRLGRRIAQRGFQLYLWGMQLFGVASFDLSDLDGLRDAGPLIIAPNHPGLLDALMVISRLPNVVCVFKASLLRNPLWGSGARLAGYIRNDWFVGSINIAVSELEKGSQLLLFPEGTRSRPFPLGEFQYGVALVSQRAAVPVQTIIIEQDTRFLAKEWPLFRRPDLPMRFRARLGRRFTPAADPRSFAAELRDYFAGELRRSPFEVMSCVR